jgi:leucyl-tRNA synthetase
MVLLLAPIAPHICEELCQRLGGAGSIFRESWPPYSEEAIRADAVEVVLQVNGKVRDVISAPTGVSREELEKLALENAKVKAHTEGKAVKKVIVIPNKLVNVVAR